MIEFFAPVKFTCWVKVLRTRLSRPEAPWRCFSSLAGASRVRRALPVHPMTAHSGASNCRI